MAIPKMTSDPYVVLGISLDAAPAAIRSSYKKLILQCHPDKVHDESLREEKAAQFQKVQEAYELLIDTRRKRKYDEEQVKKAEAAAKPQTVHTPQTTHAHPHPHSARSASGPAPGSAERSERPERRERSGTNPSPDERQRDKEREREARHARRRAAGERRSREESSWNAEERDARKAYQAEYAQREADEVRKVYEAQAAAATQARYQEEQPVPRHKSYNRYAEEPPRKASYDARQPYDMPKASAAPPPPPPPPPPQPPTDVRPGYAEAKAAEQSKIAALKARMMEETFAGSKEDILRQQQQAAAAAAAAAAGGSGAQERAKFEAARMEQERSREERGSMRGSRDRDRGTDIPSHRERKSSKSPPLRRGSSVASKCDEVPSTPMRPHIYGSSAPSHPSYPGAHPLNTGNYGIPRRRHSSPSIEKQTSRMPSREVPAPCDSGYSSPSTDTPIADKKVPSPVMRTAAEGIDPRTGNWKKYTFEVYVREDAEAQAQANGGVPSHQRRKTGSTSPSVHPAEPLGGVLPPLPAEFISQAAGIHGIPFPMAYPASVDPRYAPPPSSIHPHSPPGSHIHSPHASPPRAHRHHHHHSPVHSPRLGAEQFSPSLSRANTTHFHSHSSRSREREPSYGGYPPQLSRNSTFPG